jgi:hypothetical protein
MMEDLLRIKAHDNFIRKRPLHYNEFGLTKMRCAQKEMAELKISPAAFHGNWNHTSRGL